jgi:RNA recognition motif-containing protein
MATVSSNHFNDFDYMNGKASGYPKIPAEELPSSALPQISQIIEPYNQQRSADENLTPVLRIPQPSISGSVTSSATNVLATSNRAMPRPRQGILESPPRIYHKSSSMISREAPSRLELQSQSVLLPRDEMNEVAPTVEKEKDTVLSTISASASKTDTSSNHANQSSLAKPLHNITSSSEELVPTALIINNIPLTVNKEQFAQIMTKTGLPLPYALIYQLGFDTHMAFANFTNSEDAQIVLERMNDLELQGRKLTVEHKKTVPSQARERIGRDKREGLGQSNEVMPASSLGNSNSTTQDPVVNWGSSTACRSDEIKTPHRFGPAFSGSSAGPSLPAPATPGKTPSVALPESHILHNSNSSNQIRTSRGSVSSTPATASIPAPIPPPIPPPTNFANWGSSGPDIGWQWGNLHGADDSYWSSVGLRSSSYGNFARRGNRALEKDSPDNKSRHSGRSLTEEVKGDEIEALAELPSLEPVGIEYHTTRSEPQQLPLSPLPLLSAVPELQNERSEEQKHETFDLSSEPEPQPEPEIPQLGTVPDENINASSIEDAITPAPLPKSCPPPSVPLFVAKQPGISNVNDDEVNPQEIFSPESDFWGAEFARAASEKAELTRDIAWRADWTEYDPTIEATSTPEEKKMGEQERCGVFGDAIRTVKGGSYTLHPSELLKPELGSEDYDPTVKYHSFEMHRRESGEAERRIKIEKIKVEIRELERREVERREGERREAERGEAERRSESEASERYGGRYYKMSGTEHRSKDVPAIGVGELVEKLGKLAFEGGRKGVEKVRGWILGFGKGANKGVE